jgi:hypothetical protein
VVAPAEPTPTPLPRAPVQLQPRAPGSPPLLPPVPTEGVPIEPAPSEPPPAEPAIANDPFVDSPSPPPPRAGIAPPTPMLPGDPTARQTVDPFTDTARPAAPTRDGKPLLYAGIAFSAVAFFTRIPVSTRLVRVGNPYDALVFGNLVNLVATGAITTLIVGAVRRGHYFAHQDAFVQHQRRHNARAFAATGWTLFGVGLGAFVLSRVFTPLSCDLVNQCDFRALEASWYLSFAMVAVGAGLGSFGAAYGDRSRSYEQRRPLAITPMFDRTRAGLGISGRF